MNRIVKCFALAAACVLACATAQAATYYVATHGNDTTGDGTMAKPWLTISNGVARATVAGDTVLVSNGTYYVTDRVNMAIGINVKGLSGNPADVIVDGQDLTYCFLLNHADALLAHVTVTNGKSTTVGIPGGVYIKGAMSNCVVTCCEAPNGGGVMLYNPGTVVTSTISFNIATNSLESSVSGGGGVLLRETNTRVLDSLIIGNTAGRGGGVRTSYSGVVSNCMIMNNYATNGGGGIFDEAASIIIATVIKSNCAAASGGGLYLNDYSNGRQVIGCQIVSNYSGTTGGGVFLYRQTGLIRNCTIAGNTARTFGGGTYHGNSYTSTQLVDSCLFSNNVAVMDGGGILSYYKTIVTNCVIVNNLAGNYAGGIFLHNDGAMRDCIIRGNTATNYGGGVGIANGSRMLNCAISGNQALTDHSGGVCAATLSSYSYGAYMAIGYIGSCTIASNKASTYSGGLYMTGVSSATNTIVYGNSATANPDIHYAADAYSNYFWNCCSTRQLNQFQGNMTDNPLFLNAVAGNFRLGKGSPCINNGVNQDWMTNSLDLDKRTRIRYGTVDMGAYEHIYDATVYRAW